MLLRVVAITSLMFLPAYTLGQAPTTQSDEKTKQSKPVVIPRDIVLPVSVYQPNCPLTLEFATMHGFLDGGSVVLSRFRNQGTKVIAKYKIAWLSIGSGGSVEGRSTIAPGYSFGYEGNGKDSLPDDSVPLTKELKEALKLGNELKGLIYFMVVYLEYDDGSVFDDKETYRALEQYLDKLALRRQ